jgi:hypothetical protein
MTLYFGGSVFYFCWEQYFMNWGIKKTVITLAVAAQIVSLVPASVVYAVDEEVSTESISSEEIFIEDESENESEIESEIEESEDILIIEESESEEASNSELSSEPDDSLSADAVTGKCGDNATWSYNASTKALVISGTGAIYDYSEENPAPWNDYAPQAEKLTVKEGITRIGNYAFYRLGCDNTVLGLTTFSIPKNSLKEIGSFAFSAIEVGTSTKTFKIPDSVTSLGDNAFQFFRLQSGSKLVIGKGVKTIPKYCFQYTKATELTLSEGLETIEYKAFADFYGAKTLKFPKSLKNIKSYAFADTAFDTIVSTSYFETLTLTGDIPVIEEKAFDRRCCFVYYPGDNSTYTKDTILNAQKNFHASSWHPAGYKIGNKAGENITWSVVTKKVSGNSYKILQLKGSGPMYDYSKYNLPDYTTLHDEISGVEIDPGITSIGDYAFYCLSKMGGVYHKNTPLKLPSTLTKIGNHAFFQCNVKRVILPDSVERIEAYSMDSVAAIEGKTLPKGIKYIGDYAFYKSQAELSITFDKVEYIGKYAFYNTKNISISPAFPSTLKTIGDYAFYKCPKMTGKLVIPSSVSEIGTCAFYDDAGLTGDVEILGIKNLSQGIFIGTKINSFTFGEKLAGYDSRYIYDEFNSVFTSVTFKNSYFITLERLFSNMNRNGHAITINYPAGKGWENRQDIYGNLNHLTFVAYGDCTVKFHMPGGKVVEKKLAVGKTATAPEVTGLASGVKLLGWYTRDIIDSKYLWDFNKIIKDDLELYAKTTDDYCEVQFWIPSNLDDMYKYNEGSGTLIKVKYGQKVNPVAVSMKGAKFTGWYTDKNCTTLFDFNQPIKNHTELFSGWVKASTVQLSPDNPDLYYEKDVYQTYDVSDHFFVPVIKIKDGSSYVQLKNNADFTCKCVNGNNGSTTFTNVGDYEVLITGKGNYEGQLTVYYHLRPVDLSAVTSVYINRSDGYIYSGQPYKDVMSNINVTYEGKNLSLAKNRDYTFDLDGKGAVDTLTDAGTYKFKVKGIKNCKGTKEVSLTIKPLSLADKKVSFEQDVTLAYNGNVQKYKPVVTYTNDGKAYTLKENKDYTLKYVDEKKEGYFKEPGSYIIKITGCGNFTDTIDIDEYITFNRLISKTVVGGYKKSVPYIGKSYTPTVTVKYGGKLLKEGTDYWLSYEKNGCAGTAVIVIHGNNRAGYYGEKRVIFKITPRSLKNVELFNYDPRTIKTFTGSPVYLDNLQLKDTLNGGTSILKGAELSYYKQLEESGQYEALSKFAYTYQYKKNVNAGTASIVIKGVNNYSGTFTKNFKIQKAAISEEAINSGKIKVEYAGSVVYTKGTTKPQIRVYYTGSTSSSKVELVKGKDYTLSFANNKSVNDGSGNKTPTFTITGKGNFKGKIKRTFKITPSSITNCSATAKDIKYKNKKKNYLSKVVVKDTNGVVLTAGKDYDAKNMKYYNAATGKELTKTDIVPAGTKIKVLISGLGNYASNKNLSCTYTVLGR